MKKLLWNGKKGVKIGLIYWTYFEALWEPHTHAWLAGKLMIIDSGSNLATSSAAEDKQPPAADL